MYLLTAKQQRVFDWLRQYLAIHGRPPTRVEMAQALGFRSANAAEEHLRALARKGVVTLTPGTARGIHVVGGKGEREMVVEDDGLPVIGRVAAGLPILAAAHITAYHRVDPHIFRPQAHYLLTVIGDSMRDAGLLEGDLLAVHKTPEARDGQIVVVRIGEEVTVKRLRYRGAEVWLLPENSAYMPRKLSPTESVAIEGVGVGVLRIDVPSSFLS